MDVCPETGMRAKFIRSSASKTIEECSSCGLPVKTLKNIYPTFYSHKGTSTKTKHYTVVDHVTVFNSQEKKTINGGRVMYDPEPLVMLRKASIPDWEHEGMEVVAAHDDGSVETSFTVRTINDLNNVFCVYRGSHP